MIFVVIMSFFSTEKVFDIGNDIFFFFGNDVNICYRKIIAMILFLFSIILKTSLLVLVFFIDLVLLVQR